MVLAVSPGNRVRSVPPLSAFALRVFMSTVKRYRRRIIVQLVEADSAVPVAPMDDSDISMPVISVSYDAEQADPPQKPAQPGKP